MQHTGGQAGQQARKVCTDALMSPAAANHSIRCPTPSTPIWPHDNALYVHGMVACLRAQCGAHKPGHKLAGRQRSHNVCNRQFFKNRVEKKRMTAGGQNACHGTKTAAAPT